MSTELQTMPADSSGGALKILQASSLGGLGAFVNVPDEEYRLSAGLSNSDLSIFADSPRNYYNGFRLPVTNSMQSGLLDHRAILEHRIDVHIKPNTYGTEDKKWNSNAKECKEWMAAHNDKPVVSLDRYNEMRGIVEYVHRHPLASGLLSGGHSEVSCFAMCPKHGIRLKGRLDYVRQDDGWTTVVDLKRTRDGDTREFSKTIFYRRYHVQAAMYRRILQALGATFIRYYLIAMEVCEVPRLNVRELNPRAIDNGEDTLDRDIAKLQACVDSKIWPEWGDDNSTGQIPFIDLPEFVYANETPLVGMTAATA